MFADTVLKGLLDEPRFHQHYQLAEVRKVNGRDGVTLAAWFTRTSSISAEAIFRCSWQIATTGNVSYLGLLGVIPK